MLMTLWMAESIAGEGAVMVVGRYDVTPCRTKNSAIVRIASGVASIVSLPAEPCTCMSIRPGMTHKPLASMRCNSPERVGLCLAGCTEAISPSSMIRSWSGSDSYGVIRVPPCKIVLTFAYLLQNLILALHNKRSRRRVYPTLTAVKRLLQKLYTEQLG